MNFPRLVAGRAAYEDEEQQEGRKCGMRTIIFAVIGIFLSASSAMPCHVVDNLVTNCGFPTNTSGWSVETGTCTHNTADGSSGVGNIECDAASDGSSFTRISQCMTTGVTASTLYGYGADARLMSSTSEVTCSVTVRDFTGANCTTLLNQVSTALFTGSGSYAQSAAASLTSGLGVVTISIQIECISSADFVVRFDDAFVGVNLTPVELQEFSVE